MGFAVYGVDGFRFPVLHEAVEVEVDSDGDLWLHDGDGVLLAAHARGRWSAVVRVAQSVQQGVHHQGDSAVVAGEISRMADQFGPSSVR
jgi:hypothetical protein